MDCNIIKSSVDICETAIDGFSEEKIDFDIILPDYCSPASKIIKCDVFPAITSKRIEGEKLTLEGTCTVNIIYADEDSQMARSVSETTEFVQTHNIRMKLNNYRIRLKLRASNIVCRLQNSRRISVRAIIGVAVKTTGNRSYELIDDFDGSAIESMFDISEKCVFANSGETDIHIGGEIQTNYPVVEILKRNANLRLNDVKMIDDRIVVKGDAEIFCLYSSGESFEDIHSVSASVPFSEIIEIEGTEENDICDIVFNIISIRSGVDNSPEQNIINVEIEANASASLYKQKKIRLLKDVYSRESELSVKSEEIALESLTDTLKFENSVREAFELDIEKATVDELTCNAMIKNISFSEGNLVVDGDLSVSVAAHNDSECTMSDKTFPFKATKKLDCELNKLRCEADVAVLNTDYNMSSDDSLKFDSKLEFCIHIFSKENVSVINEIEQLSSAERKNNSKLILYYADKGELLWNIAKKYSTSVDIIKRDNNLESDILNSDYVLLISRN